MNTSSNTQAIDANRHQINKQDHDPLLSFQEKLKATTVERKKEVRRFYDERQTDPRTVDVFWGEQMQVLLPEEISSALYTVGAIEPRLSSFFYHFLQPGDVFMDVGAHIGYFSRLAAHRVGPQGKVFSFEPMPTTFEWLLKNVQDISQITPVNAAGWNQVQEVTFQDYGFVWSAYSTAYEARLPREFLKTLPHQAVQVKTVRLDDFAREHQVRPTLVKIDAESAEIFVLQGMEDYLLKEVQPVVTVEVGDLDVPGVTSSREMILWLLARGYSAFEYLSSELVPHVLRDRYEYDNIIFVPNARCAEVKTRSRTLK